jgi:hypothetical protein
LDRRLGGFQERLDDMEKRKTACSCRESNPGYPARHFTDSTLSTLFIAEVGIQTKFNIAINVGR